MIELRRVSSTEKGTFGVLLKNGLPLCVTCEDPWRDNKKNISCIPAGEYQFEKFNGQKYLNVWQLKNVPNRSAILMHAGNNTDDTEGCILVGASFGMVRGKPAVLDSQRTLNMLRAVLPDKGEVTIYDHQ